MINIPHIDGKIWNPEIILIDILYSLQTSGQAYITMDGEGSDIAALGLYDLLDTICDKWKFDPENITIVTNNQLEHHARYNIRKMPPLYVDTGQKFVQQNHLPEKQWHDIKHFGLFVSRSSWQRLWMASHIHKHYKDIAHLTYHYKPGDDYHRTHLGMDELIYHIGVDQDVKDFLSVLPIKNAIIDTYPICTPAHWGISKVYPNFVVEVVCETFLSGRSFYPTEKTWRPLLCRTPFIVLGPKNFLSNLRRLGFRTFSSWWDEGYDEDADLDSGRESVINIQKTLQRLALLNKQDLRKMYEDMMPTLEHNYHRFMSLSEQDFKTVFGYE